MCTTHTSLLYGIIVKTWSLYIAAKAHPRIVPVALALDMVIHRVGNGTLIRSDGGKVLPIEIWEMIRKEVHEVEIYDAELRVLSPLYLDEDGNGACRTSSCQGCQPIIIKPRSATSSDVATIYDPDKISLLCDGYDILYYRILNALIDGTTGEINEFIKFHHFRTSYSTLCNPNSDQMNTIYSPIFIDTQLDSGESFIDSGESFIESTIHHNESNLASATLIPTDLLLPPVSTHRFKKLVRDYRLDLAPNGSVPSFTNKSVKKSSGMESDDDPKNQDKTFQDNQKDGLVAQEKARLVVEPKWMLLSKSWDCES